MKLDFRTLRKDEEGKYFVTDTETDGEVEILCEMFPPEQWNC